MPARQGPWRRHSTGVGEPVDRLHCCGQYHHGLGGSKTFVCPTPTCPMHHVEVHRDEKAALSTLLHNWSDSVVVVQVPVPMPLPVGAGAGAGVRASAAVAV